MKTATPPIKGIEVMRNATQRLRLIAFYYGDPTGEIAPWTEFEM